MVHNNKSDLSLIFLRIGGWLWALLHATLSGLRLMERPLSQTWLVIESYTTMNSSILKMTSFSHHNPLARFGHIIHSRSGRGCTVLHMPRGLKAGNIWWTTLQTITFCPSGYQIFNSLYLPQATYTRPWKKSVQKSHFAMASSSKPGSLGTMP